VSEALENPPTVIWSHSNSIADFYELPTDGRDMREALDWLLRHYSSVKLWMGLESEDGVELLLMAVPTRKEEVVQRLTVYDDGEILMGPTAAY